MRTVVHISDVHFGRVNNAVVRPLVDAVARLQPSVVVVSGDLTQRARRTEFQQARKFLDSLPQPQIVVPGNHDVPLLNIAARFLTPLAGYRRYVSTDLEPSFVDDEIAVLGVNTARSLTWKNGRINREQLDAVRKRFAGVPSGVVKILVTHHPLDLPERFGAEHLVGRAAQAMPVLAECGVDVLLAGHYHLPHTGDTTTRYPIAGFSALVVHAGTTTSTRVRFDEPNSFNLLHITANDIIVDRFTWRSGTNEFLLLLQERFERSKRGWTRTQTPSPLVGEGARRADEG